MSIPLSVAPQSNFRDGHMCRDWSRVTSSTSFVPRTWQNQLLGKS